MSDPRTHDNAPAENIMSSTDDSEQPTDSDDGGDEPAGIWDPRFAVAALAAFTVAGLLVAVMAALAWRRVVGYSTAVRTTEQWVDGSFADRASFTLAMIGLGVGTIMLIVAAFLASMEVRSKMIALEEVSKGDRVLAIAQVTPGARSVLSAAKDIVVPIAEAITKARGTAVVAIAGTAIVIVALFQAGSIADGPPQAPPADGDPVSEEPASSPSDTGGGDEFLAPPQGE